MKKKLLYIWSLCIIMTVFCNSVFQVAVPKKLVEEKAALVLVMCDEAGCQSIGKCRLDQVQQSCIIKQKDIEIIPSDSAGSIATMELLSESNSVEQVVVYFDLNAHLKVIRVMVLKECFLDDPFFEVVSFDVADAVAFEKLYQEMEVDPLSQFTETVNSADLSLLSKDCKDQWFEQYVAYAKLFVVWQYNKMQKVVSRASSWWS